MATNFLHCKCVQFFFGSKRKDKNLYNHVIFFGKHEYEKLYVVSCFVFCSQCEYPVESSPVNTRRCDVFRIGI